ncbi:sigma-70 family RNA polymerase sigma factor [Dyella mobilis]|uniref:Sigma-70 family RNA polymerase sigma factor n=1 Tax=Dyella mobilis TaxID=1849582 RepID=A0ABS2KMY1_9GAMM|nr:sigma-70 family RNA polymerase sigma factor [Dyella mobilis]MBM7131798.1 sigma-70 family RNA polymerase sigma factor [Dyella mobilis]GLQ96223.1 RNA polymerase sigma factor [Dyella mobilis]
MDENKWLAERFQAQRVRLQAVAYRMLGSHSEAEDAVQETWLRLNRADTSDVENLAGWLTTVLSRVCLDTLRSRQSRREESLDLELAHPALDEPDGGDPAHEVLLADSVGSALLLVLQTLSPAERLAFVLHDMFAVSFDDIAPIIDRTPVAARQLASRARRRVQGANEGNQADPARQREVVAAFLSASRNGDFSALLALLDPEVVLRADAFTVQASIANQASGAPRLFPETVGAKNVADTFSGRAKAARLVLIDGLPGAVWAPGGEPRVAFRFAVDGGRITQIELVADPEQIRHFDLTWLEH